MKQKTPKKLRVIRRVQDPDLFNRAVVHHLRWCEDDGFVPDQPAADFWADELPDGRRRIDLANVRGVIGRCETSAKTGRLRVFPTAPTDARHSWRGADAATVERPTAPAE